MPKQDMRFLKAWAEVEKSIHEVMAVDSRLKTASLTDFLSLVAEKHLLDQRDLTLLRDFHSLRTQFLHGRRDLTTENAEVMEGASGDLVSRITTLRKDELEMGQEDWQNTTCFVIGPIGDPLAKIGSPERTRFEMGLRVWEKVINPACSSLGIDPLRADKITRPGEITDQIFRNLRDADVVIADVTGGNPNVLYELGLRHTTGKLTIQIGEAGRLPFDVQAIRTIRFNPDELGYVEARENLVGALRTGLESGSDQVSATRVWLEGNALQAAAEGLEGPDDSDESPGFMDLIAEAEEAMPLVGEYLSEAAEITEEIGSVMRKASEDLEEINVRGGTMKERLRLTRRVASDLSEPAARMNQTAESYAEVMGRVDSGISVLISNIEEEPALLAESGELPEAIHGIADAARNALPSADEYAKTLADTSKLSKDLRPRTNRIAAAVKSIINSSQPIFDWDSRLTRLRKPDPES